LAGRFGDRAELDYMKLRPSQSPKTFSLNENRLRNRSKYQTPNYMRRVAAGRELGNRLLGKVSAMKDEYF
jgi:hypothetical protein